jgi:hypothetical protein
MGSYMAFRHHLPDDETLEGVDPVSAAQLTHAERAELDDE